MPAALDPMAPTEAVSASDTPFTDIPLFPHLHLVSESHVGSVLGGVEAEPLSAQFKSELTTKVDEMVERLGRKILDSEEHIWTDMQATQDVLVNKLDTVALSLREIILRVQHMDTFTDRKTRCLAPAEVPAL